MDRFDNLKQALIASAEKIEELHRKLKEKRQEYVAQHGPIFRSIQAEAVWTGQIEGLEAFIAKPRIWKDCEEMAQSGDPTLTGIVERCGLEMGYNGYAVFPKRPVIEPGNKGIVTYIPVHGGITYFEEHDGEACYGFDTCHDSGNFPARDLEWIKGQIAVMINGLIYAASIEPEYLAGWTDNQRKAEALQPLADMQPGQSWNTGVMLNLLSGDL